MTNKNVLIIIGLIILVLSGVIFSLSLKPKPQPEQPAITQPLPETKEEPKPQEIETSNWKTYLNEEYGFELKYPEDWVVVEEGFNKIILQSLEDEFGVYSGVKVLVCENPLNFSLDEFYYQRPLSYIYGGECSTLNPEDKQNEQKLTLWDKEVLLIDGVYWRRLPQSIAGIKISNYVIELLTFAYSTEKATELLKQILSTFKFIK